MSDVFLPLVFGVVGLAILVLPAETLLKWDRRTGYYIYTNNADKVAGLRNARIFYKVFGAFFIGISMVLGLFAATMVMERNGGFTRERTSIQANWVTAAGTARLIKGSESSARPAANGQYSRTQENIAIGFYARTGACGTMTYTWAIKENEVKSIGLPCQSGQNWLYLHEIFDEVPSAGKHAVHLTKDGVSVALIWFELTE